MFSSLFWGSTFCGVYIPCIYSQVRLSHRGRFRSLLLCPLSVEHCYFASFKIRRTSYLPTQLHAARQNSLVEWRWWWSDYGKSLPGEFISRLKIEQNCRLFLDIFSSAIMNDSFMTLTPRLKVDVKCVSQQWNWITVTNYFGTPPANWVHGYQYFEHGTWVWTKGFRRYLHIAKDRSRNFPLNSTRVRALGWSLLWIFSGFLNFFFLGRVCGANHF